MPKSIDVPGSTAPGGHYSHAVAGAGLVFVSGQLPVDPKDGKLVGHSFARQAECALENVMRALHAAGSSADRLMKVNVYITNIELWPEFDAIYRAKLGDCRPARAVIPVSELHFGFLIEIDAVAEL